MPFAPHVSVVIGRRRTLAAVLIGLAVGAIGCVESREPAPEACAASAVEVELTLTTSSLNPGDPSACRGQVVTLQIEFGYTILSLWIIAQPIVIEPGGAAGAGIPTRADASASVR